MECKVEEKVSYTLVLLPEGNYDVAELGALLAAAPAVDATMGVVLSGRAPVWAFAALSHLYHPTKWVATMDPRLGGAVVVQSHGGPAVGTVVKE